MKFRLIVAIVMIISSFSATAQNSFLVNFKAITPSINFLDSKYHSFGFDIGYGRDFANGRFGVDITAFADFLNYSRDLPELRKLDGTTFYTGLALTPRYCFNPEKEVRLSLICSVKGGYNYGRGIVTQQYLGADDNQIENQSVGADFTLNFVPAIAVNR